MSRRRRHNPGVGFEVRMGQYPSESIKPNRENNRKYLKLIWTAATLPDAKFIAQTFAKEHPTMVITVDRA